MEIGNLPGKAENFFSIHKIEQAVEKYEKIFLFDCQDERTAKLAENFCKSISYKNLTKKILVMSNTGFLNEKMADCQKLSEKEYNDLCKLYSMYEFSDRFQIIAGSSQYGNLQNYITTGLLTEEEMFEALLYERK